MRIALIVGINYYESAGQLFGCVNDAHSVKAILERHDGGDINFESRILTGTGPADRVNKADLKDAIEQLYRTDAEIALFYFAGHGHIESAGGYIVASDAKRGDDGVSLSEILTFANNSPAKNRVIILDSCHSGFAGTLLAGAGLSAISEGVTILTASTKDQYATEENGHGVFTSLLVDALHGGAANLMGDITPGSVYAHIDQSLGAWEQRPIFKTNIRQFVSLRRSTPPITRAELLRITEFFPKAGFEFQLDPTYEPSLKGRDQGMPAPISENVRKFEILQRYNRLNLLIPVSVPHMWNAAMESKTCRLTALGEHYRRLAEKKRI